MPRYLTGTHGSSGCANPLAQPGGGDADKAREKTGSSDKDGAWNHYWKKWKEGGGTSIQGWAIPVLGALFCIFVVLLWLTCMRGSQKRAKALESIESEKALRLQREEELTRGREEAMQTFRRISAGLDVAKPANGKPVANGRPVAD